MEIAKLSEIRSTERFKQIMARSKEKYAAVLPLVEQIMREVKIKGDAALLRYTAQFDKVTLRTLAISQQEIKAAYAEVDKTLVRALKQVAAAIQKASQDQKPPRQLKTTNTVPGIKVWTEWRAIERVGLYIPGGLALYPSTVLMNAIPARIAGCKKIMLVSPPQPNGKIAPVVLVAADIAGLKEIYTVGGAQAIAALTYGTETVPKVNKIFGPGNAYVAAAKLAAFMSGEVAVDSPAGPSEVFIIADDTANPRWVAADLVCDAEHGEDSASVLATTSPTLAKRVAEEVEKIISTLATGERIRKSIRRYSLIAVVDSLDEAIDFANDYAPEHLEIVVKKEKYACERIENAGSVFVGPFTCKSSGDYATGANHVLPTGGAAKMFSPLSTVDFMRRVEFQAVSKNGLERIRNTIELLSAIEQLPGHAYSCRSRFEKI